MVTGANQGLGLQTSLDLAKKGATVYMVCRNEERGMAAVNKVKEATKNENVFLKICDVSSLSSIKSLAREYLSSEHPLHILIHNAGVMLHERTISADGYEMNFATNTLAPLALTHALQPALEKEPSRVIIVASGGMLTENLVIDDMQCENVKKFDGMVQYARDKRRQVVIGEALADEFGRSEQTKNIGVYSMHPGWTETEGVKSSIPDFYSKLQSKFRSLEQGTDTILWLCLADASSLMPGALYLDRKVQSKHLPLAWTKYSETERNMLMSKLQELL